MQSLRPLALVLLFVSLAGQAAPTPAPVRAEIDALLGELQRQACRLERNGSWHSADEARTHMLRKLAYLEDRGTVQSVEQFIDQAATQSSSSGKPYRVQCGTVAPQASRDWLLTALRQLRGRRAASAAAG